VEPFREGPVTNQVARVAAVCGGATGLRVEVEGHTDSVSTEGAVLEASRGRGGILIREALSANTVTGARMGNYPSMYSNASAGGRMEEPPRGNPFDLRFDAIGVLPFWDRAYTLSMRVAVS